MFTSTFILVHCCFLIFGAFAQDNVNDTQRCFLIKPETSLALGCEPEYKTPFFWYYGKDETRYLPKGHVELRTSQLLFHGVQLSDAGRYICRSVKDPVVETTYHLVTPILTQREPTWTKVALIGSSVALDCDFVADPQPHIEWFIGSDHAELKKRAHHRVHISSNPRTGVPNSRLIVQNVNPSDNNAYTCRASHLMCGIQTEQVVMLRAQQSEILTNEGDTEYGFQGVVVNPKSQRLVLKCNYTGERYWNEDAEPPTYQWYKNQSLITKSSKYNIVNEGSASALTVSSCDVSDAGNYTCKFNNKQEATLAVYMYPTIDHVEGSKIQVQGDPLTLLCKARGAPTPTVTWYKEDAQLETDERIELLEVDGVANAKLVIKDLQYHDKGHYVCKAKAANVTRSVEIHVRVKDKYAALWPFLGICAEVAVLCTIIFIYERRRTKPEFEDDDDKKESSSRK